MPPLQDTDHTEVGPSRTKGGTMQPGDCSVHVQFKGEELTFGTTNTSAQRTYTGVATSDGTELQRLRGGGLAATIPALLLPAGTSTAPPD